MAYFLRRESDGAGANGPLSALVFEESISYHSKPKVGYCIQVGCLCIGDSAKPFQTDEIIEILLDVRNYVRFRTSTATYEWWEK